MKTMLLLQRRNNMSTEVNPFDLETMPLGEFDIQNDFSDWSDLSQEPVLDDSVYEEAPKKKILDPEAYASMPLFRTLSLDDLNNLPNPEWIIDGIIPADAMTTVFGAPGSTKSFFALDLACCIASGHGFNGALVKKGKVIYCIGEGLRGMKWRIEAWKLAHPDADFKALEENLIILPRAVMLLDKTESGMLVNTAEMYNEDLPLRMFIIDTWARSLTGGDENSAQDVGIAISVCDAVRAKTGATSLIIHHTGAEGSRERGSTALRGATDTTIQMTHNETDGIVTIACKKMKDGEPFQNLRYSLKQFGHSIVLTPSVIPSFTNGGLSPTRDKQYWIDKAKADRESPF